MTIPRNLHLTRMTIPPDWATSYRVGSYNPYALTADLLVFAINREREDLEVLTIHRKGDGPFQRMEALPGGFVDWGTDHDAAAAAVREFEEETRAAEKPYLIPLSAYTTNGRDPRQYAGEYNPVTDTWSRKNVRIVSQAFLGLGRKENFADVAQTEETEKVGWTRVYQHLPWEDVRTPEALHLIGEIRRDLYQWAHLATVAEGKRRSQRIRQLFGEGPQGWDEERALERLQLLMEAGLLEESHRDMWGRANGILLRGRRLYGVPMAFDHRFMLAEALDRLRKEIKSTPDIMRSLLPEEFTLTDLRVAFKATHGRGIVRSNFRRLFTREENAPLLEALGKEGDNPGPGPKADLYRFAAETECMRMNPPLRVPWLPLGEQ